MHIIYVGYPGFPLGHAQVERQKLIAKGLVECGCDVTIISRYGIHQIEDIKLIPNSKIFEGIRFEYASGIAYRPNSFLKRNIYKFKGLLREVYLICKYRFEHRLDAVMITTNSFYNVVLYSIISFICGVPSVLDNVEFFSSHKSIGFWEKLDNHLYDKFAYKWASRVICISNYLLDIVKNGSPQKPVVKVPAIVDFSKFQDKATNLEPYFLFCGSAVYYEILDFIIESYDKLEQNTYKLYIVSNGTQDQVDRVKNRINLSKRKENIKYHSNLSYENLTKLYTSSRALLIPLLNREQDIARFPHKIGEYCASSRVIVTTKVGEIPLFFKDQENALVARNTETSSFAKKMQQVIDFPEMTHAMAEKAYLTGKENFDYYQLSKRVFNFLKEKHPHNVYSRE